MNKLLINGSGAKAGHKISFIFLIILLLLILIQIIPTTSADTTTELQDNTDGNQENDKNDKNDTNINASYPAFSNNSPTSRQIVTTDLISINLYEEGQSLIREAKVAPGDLRTISVKGKVEMTSWGPLKNIDQVLVSLHAEIEEEGWTAMPAPPSVFFNYLHGRTPDPEEFTLIVNSKFRAPVSDEGMTVTITGDWMTMPMSSSGTVAPDSIDFTVVQFTDLLLDSLDPLVQTSPGSVVDFKLQIHNRGNFVDDFNIEFLNDKSLEDRGWAFEILDTLPVENIEPWEYKTVTIRVRSPQRFTLWKNQMTEILIRVSSVSAKGSYYEALGTKDYSFYFYERGVYLPPEPTACLIIGFIILIVIIVYVRKRAAKKLLEGKKNSKNNK